MKTPTLNETLTVTDDKSDMKNEFNCTRVIEARQVASFCFLSMSRGHLACTFIILSPLSGNG